MADKVEWFKCPYCYFMRTSNFDICPGCGTNQTTGEGKWKPGQWSYKENPKMYRPLTIPKRQTFIPTEKCLADECAKGIREARNLPPGCPVPVLICCPCPKCNPQFSC